MGNRKIVIIDISDFENRKHEISQQLLEASKDVGFFYIRGMLASPSRLVLICCESTITASL